MDGGPPRETGVRTHLNTHDPLSVSSECERIPQYAACLPLWIVLQVEVGDVDRLRWSGLKAELAVPRHILDGEEGGVGLYRHICERDR